jgi:hypothetical protein
MNRIPWEKINPWIVLKWGFVVFAYCLGILIILSIILTMFGVYG